MLKRRILVLPDLSPATFMTLGISEQRPSTALTVDFPKFRAKSDDPEHTEWVRSGMHEDMALAFWREISSWKPETRSKVLICGRALTEPMWDQLSDDPMFDFFYSERNYRSNRQLQDKAIGLILPARLKDKIPQEVGRRWAKLTFTPESLSEKVGHKTAWYPAELIYRYGNGVRSQDEDSAVYRIKPILCAVNSFDIGTNRNPALARMAKTKLELAFNTIHSGAIYRTQQENLAYMASTEAAYTIEI